MTAKRDRSTYDFEVELRISPTPVIGVLLLFACSLYVGAEIVTSQWETVDRIVSLSLTILGFSAIGGLLMVWHPLVGRWAILLSMLPLIYFASIWLSAPEILTLAVIPVAVGTPLLRFTASAVVAALEVVLLTAMAVCQPALITGSALLVALIGIGATLATTYATHHTVHRLLDWLEEYFARNQQFLEEARDRKEQLEQALDGFASANRQLALANERTTALRAIAEEAQRAKTAFVANVSHEFRTPLNMIIGLVDLMVESPEIYAVVLSPEIREDLQVIHRNCEHLSNMINDVLDLTRMEAGRLSLHRERVQLAEIVDSSVAAVSPLLQKKHLEVLMSIPEDLPEVFCDRTRVQQVILNLVSNAARFTEEGEIAIAVERRDQQVQVSVRDTGPGIAPEDAKKIFEPFEQGRLWHGTGGSGLGLSISKRFVELHGGRMWLKSEVGEGTTFYFTLPISAPIQHVARPGHAIRPDWVWREQTFRASQVSYSDELVKPRMIVYDEAGDLFSWFSRYSDDVEFVSTRHMSQVTEALEESPAHALVLNAEDPEDLWPLVQQAQRRANGTPIIGYSVPRLVERAIDAGALGYLVKPVTRADLASALEAVEGAVQKILIVDDDPDVLQLFSRMLRLYDHNLQISTTQSGSETLAHLRTDVPDLMLLDVVMADMDGWQVLETIRQDPLISNVPTIFVSAQDLSDRPLASDLLVATIEKGIPLSKLLRCSQELSTLLLEPETGLDLMPE